ncbi:hypothetical protein C0995_008653 [Termitomyces sp. Mi166|nr:hypothetical protein C0995_008653 [Termitomyces sp. Mi166\
MPLMMSSRLSWFILLTLAWRVVAQDPTAHLTTRQDPPILDFVGVFDSELISCAPASFNWVYTGPNGLFSFFLTEGVGQDTATSEPFADSSNPNARSLYRRDNVKIASSISVSSGIGQLNVTSLSVPQGRYRLLAIATSISPSYSAQSSVFIVNEGTNTSCLSSLSTSSSTSTLSSSATSDLASITSSDVSSASTSATVVPVGEISSTPVNKGAIAGGVVAGAVVLIAAVMFYFFFVVYPRRSRVHSHGPHGHTPANVGFGIGSPAGGDGARWGGLGSVDSHFPSGDPKAQRPHVRTGRQSAGAGASQDDMNSYLSRSGSVTYGGYAGSPSEEKFSGSPSEEMVLSTLPYRGPESNVYAPNNTDLATPFEHRRSQSHAWRASLESSSIHVQSPFTTSPASSPVTLARNGSAGAQNTPRKTARKPVPAYDESSAFSVTSPVSSSPPAVTTTPLPDPVLPHPAPVSSGHYSTRAERESLKSQSSKSKSKSRNRDKSNTSSTNASSEEITQQDLVHKNSFGPGGVEGKQLHYLIPDMPMGHR